MAVVVTVGFWRSLQNIDFTLSKGPIGGGGTLVLATPVLTMLALIGFAWVSFSNPIAYGVAAAPPAATDTSTMASTPSIDFRGSTPNPAAQDLATRRLQVIQHIRNLNCIAKRTASLSPTQVNAFAQAKFALMTQVWDPAWGDLDAFAQWLIFRDSANPAARAVFEEILEC